MLTARFANHVTNALGRYTPSSVNEPASILRFDRFTFETQEASAGGQPR